MIKLNKSGKLNFIIAMELAILTIIFCAVAMTVDVRPVGPKNSLVGLASLNLAFHNSIGVNMTWYKITQVLGYLACLLVAVMAVIGLIQLIKRKSLLKVDKTILEAGCLYLVMFALYVIFEKLALNYRPIIMPGETALEASFPSSHTMLGIVVFGSIAMIAKDYIQDSKICRIVRIVMTLLLIAIVVGRLLSGVHWMSDIVASVLISATLLQLFHSFRVVVKDDKQIVGNK
jgi:membrane-associated phospholipid phosphatase